jgi:hypothetical protein
MFGSQTDSKAEAVASSPAGGFDPEIDGGDEEMFESISDAGPLPTHNPSVAAPAAPAPPVAVPATATDVFIDGKYHSVVQVEPASQSGPTPCIVARQQAMWLSQQRITYSMWVSRIPGWRGAARYEAMSLAKQLEHMVSRAYKAERDAFQAATGVCILDHPWMEIPARRLACLVELAEGGKREVATNLEYRGPVSSPLPRSEYISAVRDSKIIGRSSIGDGMSTSSGGRGQAQSGGRFKGKAQRPGGAGSADSGFGRKQQPKKGGGGGGGTAGGAGGKSAAAPASV